MPAPPASVPRPRLPRLPAAILATLLPPAERDELLADVADEYAERHQAAGPAAAGHWLWGQLFRSAPALVR